METVKPPLWWHTSAALIALPLLFVFSFSLSFTMPRSLSVSLSHSHSSIYPPLWVNYGVWVEGRGCFVFCHLQGLSNVTEMCHSIL